MNHQFDQYTHSVCGKAFAVEIAKTLQHILAKQPSLDTEEKRALLSQVLFAIYAHLSGSSFAGRVQGREICPVLGFSVGEDSDAVYFGSGLALHEQVSSILKALG